MFFKHLSFQLRNLFTHFGFYLVQVSLALFAIFFVQVVQKNIEVRIEKKGQVMLGGDISLSTRGKWLESQPEVIKYINEISEQSTEVIEVPVMITVKNRSLLVSTVAIKKEYPLFGDLEVTMNGVWRESIQNNEVLVYQEVLDQMGAVIGDTVRLGSKTLKIVGVVTNDESGGTFTALLPKLFVASSVLETSGLIGAMSAETRKELIRLKQGLDLNVVLEALKDKINDPAVRIRSRENVNEQSTRILDYLTDYMGLISIVTILLTFFGSLYLFRHYFLKQLQNIAILRSLGFGPNYINRLWMSQMLVLAILVTITTYIVTYFLFPMFAPWLLKGIAKDLQFEFYGDKIYIIFIYSLMLSLLTHFMYSHNIKNIKSSFLLKQGGDLQDLNMSKLALFVFVTLFAGISFIASNSWIVTGIFISSVLIFFVISYILLKIGFYFLYSLRTSISGLKYISLNFYRNSTTYLFLMISLSFGFTLLSFLPSLKTSLLTQLEQTEDRPRLFLFDIQDFQLDELKDFLQTENISLQQESPLIRARLLKVNDKDVVIELDDRETTREASQASRFRNRAFNLSYRKELSKAEEIISGNSFKEAKTVYPKVSIESRFADRMGLELHDILTFDIQDIEIKAEIVNLRSVNWFSFQPNFFVLFEDGILNDAPKTFLATINNIDDVRGLQYKVSSNFSNISILDLERVISKVLDISNDFEFVLQVMSYFCIIMGIFIFLSIYVHFMERRRFDIQIMKVVGFSFRRIFILGMLEYGISLSYAVGLGILIGSMLSYLLVVHYFQWAWTFDWFSVAIQGGLVFFTSFILMVVLTVKDFIKKPHSLLKTEM